jgi:phasin family protein
MNNVSADQISKRFENVMWAPMQAYAHLTLEYTEKLVNAQFSAMQACADVGLRHARGLFDIRSLQDLPGYLESRQSVIQTLNSQLTTETERLVAMNQEYVNKAQQLTESNVREIARAAVKPAG